MKVQKAEGRRQKAEVDVDSDSSGPSGAFVGALVGMIAAGLLLLWGLCALADVLASGFGGV